MSLSTNLQGHAISYQARRHTKRIISDCFCRGMLRVPNETCKLNDKALDTEPTAAEMLVLSPYMLFPGSAYLAMVEGRTSTNPKQIERGILQLMARRDAKGNRVGEPEIVVRKLALLYGCRGRDPELHYLSPHEFDRWWQVRPLTLELLSQTNVKQFPTSGTAGILAKYWVMEKRQRAKMKA